VAGGGPVITGRAACGVLVAALAAGCGAASSNIESSGRSPAPTLSPGDVATSTPGPSFITLGDASRALDAGTYRIELNRLATGGAEFPPMLVTLPDGWSNFHGWALNRGWPGDATVAVSFWDVDQVYGHPCKWSGTLFQPGPTVNDLAEALVDSPLRNATPPVDVRLDGFAGRYLEWSVPADIEFSSSGFPAPSAGCDSDSDGTAFQSWTGNGWAGNRYQQGAGQVDRLWILDVNGARLVIDAFYMPTSTDAERQQLEDVVQSIHMVR